MDLKYFIILSMQNKLIKFGTGLAGIWTKIENTEILLNGPDGTSIDLDFLSGSFYHSLSKSNFTIQQNIMNFF